jgi:hypothetical protein
METSTWVAWVDSLVYFLAPLNKYAPLSYGRAVRFLTPHLQDLIRCAPPPNL